MLQRSAFAPRKTNSGRQNDGKRFSAHLKWIRGRRCILSGRNGHICEGRIEAMHVDEAGGKGTGMKVSDVHTVPACSGAHYEAHRIGARTWQAKYSINLVDAAKQYAKASPHRHQWENPA